MGVRALEDAVEPTDSVVFLGAGVSADDNLPTWSALLASLLDDASVSRTEVGTADFLTILHLLEERGVTFADGPRFGEELDALRELRRLKEAIAVAMRYLVAHGRASGRTWAEIGGALGTSAQNVQSNYRLAITTNYDRLIDEATRDYADEPPTLSANVRPLPTRLTDVIDAHRADHPDAPRTIVLTGRVGTGKTAAAYLIAEALQWPLKLVTPGDLLTHGVEDVPRQIATVFSQLARHERTVILLDEMDHFIGDCVDGSVEERLVTVALLAGLQRLHESDRSLVVLTTQRREEEIDAAVLRRGRIDELIEMS